LVTLDEGLLLLEGLLEYPFDVLIVVQWLLTILLKIKFYSPLLEIIIVLVLQFTIKQYIILYHLMVRNCFTCTRLLINRLGLQIQNYRLDSAL